jgi:hypothetical protein
LVFIIVGRSARVVGTGSGDRLSKPPAQTDIFPFRKAPTPSAAFVARHGRDRKDAAQQPGQKSIAPLADANIVAEVALALHAGTDTVATMLSYLLYELARHPHWLARLRAELTALPVVRAMHILRWPKEGALSNNNDALSLSDAAAAAAAASASQ